MADERTIEQVPSEDLFKSATAPPAAEPPTPAPEVVPEVVAGAQSEPTPEPTPTPVPPPTPPPTVEPTIPPWRLREEAEARRVAEDRARQLEQRLQEIAAHVQQQQKPSDFFENPDQATQAAIMRTLQPYAEETRRNLMYMGKMVAGSVHGADKVEAAEQAFLKARSEESLDPSDYERVVQSPNRYDAVVQWHKRQSTLAAVGDDPNVWFEKQLAAKMADPKFQASLLEKVREDAATRASVTKLPPSLSKSTAVAGNAGTVGDLSDASLFAHAMKR